MTKREDATFGDAIRRIRKDRGLTIAEVARRVGTTLSYICDVENNRHSMPLPPRVERIIEILEAQDEADHLRALAARGRRRVEIRVEGLPLGAIQTALKFGQRLGDLSAGALAKIDKLLASAK